MRKIIFSAKCASFVIIRRFQKKSKVIIRKIEQIICIFLDAILAIIKTIEKWYEKQMP